LYSHGRPLNIVSHHGVQDLNILVPYPGFRFLSLCFPLFLSGFPRRVIDKAFAAVTKRVFSSSPVKLYNPPLFYQITSLRRNLYFFPVPKCLPSFPPYIIHPWFRPLSTFSHPTAIPEKRSIYSGPSTSAIFLEEDVNC